jgi:triacylglycerol lipase
MIARLQRVFTVALLAGALGWFVYALLISRPMLAALGMLVIVVGYAGFMAAEFVILSFVQSEDAAPRPTVVQLCSAWWGEIKTAPCVFLWRQPFCSTRHPDHLPFSTGKNARRGVVLVHGFFCNRGLWNPWMRDFRQQEIPFVAVNLEPVLGSIDQYAHLIDAAVARVQAATGLAPVLVGHSMGGLAIRAWAAKHRAAARVHHVITIGSPHHGTWLAGRARSANGRQMRLRSPWLEALARAEAEGDFESGSESGSKSARAGQRKAAAIHERFTCFFGHCDNIVFPAPTAMLSGARNIHLPGTAHVHMAYHPEVFAETLRSLA